MNLFIIHLSDIHFKIKDNYIFSKRQSLLDFLTCEIGKTDEVLFLISGDISSSGKIEEYVVAEEYFSFLYESLKSNSIKVNFFIVPGNHDCNFEIQDEDVRLSLTDSIKSLNFEKTKSGVINELCKVQKNFIELRKVLPCNYDMTFSDELLTSFKKKNISIHCFNTAWCSKKHEDPGTLYFPCELYEDFFVKTDDAFTICLFHHPLGWLHPDNARNFQEFLETNFSIVFTGHEHITGSSSTHNFEKDINTIVIKGDVLQDFNSESSSGFNIVKINLEQKQQQIFTCKYCNENQIYKSYMKRDWFSFSGVNGIDRRKIKLSNSFERFLNESEVPLIHPHKQQDVKIEDVYIPPDFEKIEYLSKKNKTVNVVNSDDLLSSEKINYLIMGDEKSGKTTFLKKTFLKFFNQGFCPVYIHASCIKSPTLVEIEKVISANLEKIYGEKDYSAIVSNKRDKKIILIDDFHVAKLNPEGKAKFVNNLKNKYGNIIITANFLVLVEEVSSNKTLFAELSGSEHYKIQEFGRYLRYKLIEKWNRLGQEYSVSEKDLVQKIDESKRIVEGTIKNNLIPSTPMFILTLLQGIESKNSFSTNNSAYGHYYEFLITRAFGLIGKKIDQLDFYYNYVTELSFFFFDKKARQISEESFNCFHKKFCDIYQETEKIGILQDLQLAKIIEYIDGNYRFTHKYFYYFFVAKYISKLLEEGDIDDIAKPLIKNMAERVHIEEFYNIITFLTHHTKDPYVLNTVINSSKKIFSDIEFIKFDEDVLVINKLMDEIPEIVMEEPDFSKNREEKFKIQDTLERAKEDPYYSQDYDLNAEIDELSYITKLNLAFKSIEILGQILRNHYGSLKKPIKNNIAEEAYKIGLRALNMFFTNLQEDCDRAVIAIKDILKQKSKGLSKKDAENKARELLFNLCEIVGIVFIKKVSSSLGHEKLQETFCYVLENNPYHSIRLINLCINLEYGNIIPFDLIERMKNDFKGSFVSLSLLNKLIIQYIHMFPTTVRERQKICEILNIQSQERKYLEMASHKHNF